MSEEAGPKGIDGWRSLPTTGLLCKTGASFYKSYIAGQELAGADLPSIWIACFRISRRVANMCGEGRNLQPKTAEVFS